MRIPQIQAFESSISLLFDTSVVRTGNHIKCVNTTSLYSNMWAKAWFDLSVVKEIELGSSDEGFEISNLSSVETCTFRWELNSNHQTVCICGLFQGFHTVSSSNSSWNRCLAAARSRRKVVDLAGFRKILENLDLDDQNSKFVATKMFLY